MLCARVTLSLPVVCNKRNKSLFFLFISLFMYHYFYYLWQKDQKNVFAHLNRFLKTVLRSCLYIDDFLNEKKRPWSDPYIKWLGERQDAHKWHFIGASYGSKECVCTLESFLKTVLESYPRLYICMHIDDLLPIKKRHVSDPHKKSRGQDAQRIKSSYSYK